MPRDGIFANHTRAVAPEVPTLVCQLAAGERLLLWAWRLWLEGLVTRDSARHEQAWRGLSKLLGAAPARRLLDAVSRLIFRCVRDAQSEIAYHPSCCRRLGADEYRVLCLVAAAGAGDLGAARVQAEALLRGGAATALLPPAAELAAALEAAGHGLTPRPDDPRSTAILRAAEAMPLLDRSRPN